MIFQRTGCPVIVDPDRVNASRQLLDNHFVNVIVSDDGLQHYGLGRDIEIAVVDGELGLGNGRCLPAGPLREPPSRLADVDLVIVNGGDEDAVDSRLPMQTARISLVPVRLVNIVSGGEDELDSLDGRTVHAVAGISNPQRFFDTLTGLGCQVVPHQFPDHHLFVESDLEFDDDLPVIMTEKDAVKLNRLAFASHHNQFWYLEVDAILPETEINGLLIRTGLLPVANGV